MDTDAFRLLFHNVPDFSVMDSVIFCDGDSVNVSVQTAENLQYMWSDGSTASSNYISEGGWSWVEASNEHCSETDSIWAHQQYTPPPDTIMGSASVCPGVEGVTYFVEHPEDDIANTWWDVSGGSIAGLEDLNITVDWSLTNDNARVRFVSISAEGCPSDTAAFDVKINEILETEMPTGLVEVCHNLPLENYSIIPTNGSVYDWQAENGTIVEGQGTSEVSVQWEGTGMHSLQVLETSNTDITTCFGTSPPLNVEVFEDSANLWINYVSVSVATDRTLEVQWILVHPHRLQLPLDFSKREGFTADMEKIKSVTVDNDHFDTDVNTAQESYGYQLRGFNFCQEELVSNIHQSMVLTGSANEDETEISLAWNAYEGWRFGGVARYYVIRQLDGNTKYDTVAVLDKDATSVQLQNATDGFNHRFRVVASTANGTVSLSNHVDFEFKHELFIPNVVTPNADQQNDYFIIPKIELYPQAEFTILNRQAKKIYQTKGYQNNWSAAELSAGTYYYYLSIPNLNREYKGWFSVLK